MAVVRSYRQTVGGWFIRVGARMVNSGCTHVCSTKSRRWRCLGPRKGATLHSFLRMGSGLDFSLAASYGKLRWVEAEWWSYVRPRKAVEEAGVRTATLSRRSMLTGAFH